MLHRINKSGIRIGIGVVCIQSIDIRHQDQQICPDQCRHHSGKGIVIPEFLQSLQLVCRNGVVFIYDWDYPQLQKLIKGILRVFTVGIVHHGILGHQNLSCGLIILGKKLLVNHHQPGLAYRSTCLLYLQVGWLFLHSKGRCTYGNGP